MSERRLLKPILCKTPKTQQRVRRHRTWNQYFASEDFNFCRKWKTPRSTLWMSPWLLHRTSIRWIFSSELRFWWMCRRCMKLVVHWQCRLGSSSPFKLELAFDPARFCCSQRPLSGDQQAFDWSYRCRLQATQAGKTRLENWKCCSVACSRWKRCRLMSRKPFETRRNRSGSEVLMRIQFGTV